MALPNTPCDCLRLLPKALRTNLGLSSQSFKKELIRNETEGWRVALYRDGSVTPFVRIEEKMDPLGHVAARAVDANSLVLRTTDRTKLLEALPGSKEIAKDTYYFNFTQAGGEFANYVYASDPIKLFGQYAKRTGINCSLIEPNAFVSLPAKQDGALRPFQWNSPFIHLPDAHAKTRGIPEIIVAVLDSGIFRNHQEFRDAHILPGVNIVDPNQEADDSQGHGTACSGAIVAQERPRLLGVAPGCSLLPIKIFGKSETTLSSRAVEGITQAKQKNVRLISMSFTVTSDVGHLRHAIESCPDILFVAAGGDGAEITNRNPIFPASFELDNIISVIGCKENEHRADCSSFDRTGRRAHIAAPGHEIDICDIESVDDYTGGCGTSFAAPQVAGVCALLWSLAPTATVKMVRDRILHTAKKVPHLRATCRAEGYIDADAAVSNFP